VAANDGFVPEAAIRPPGVMDYLPSRKAAETAACQVRYQNNSPFF
jgi:hypothetical protein